MLQFFLSQQLYLDLQLQREREMSAPSLSGCPCPISQAQTGAQCSLSHSLSPLLLQADVTASALPQLPQNSVSL